MQITKTLYIKNRDEWRQWLSENHATAKEIWLISYSKDSGKRSILYLHAVEEALCFGWIDGIAKKIDDERLAQRFTPRRPKSNWTELNKERAKRLIQSGKMTEAGLKVLPIFHLIHSTSQKTSLKHYKPNHKFGITFSISPMFIKEFVLAILKKSVSNQENFKNDLKIS